MKKIEKSLRQIKMFFIRIIMISLLLIIDSGYLTTKAGNLWLPSFFSSHMVLQQQKDVFIWGKADIGEEVQLNTTWGVSAQAKADETGRWKAKVKTPSAGGPYSIKIKAGESEITLEDVLIGEVWLCSGQSNMEMPLGGWPPRDTIIGASNEIAQANNPYLRTFTVNRSYSIIPVDSCIGTWISLNKSTASQFSATAYFFGKKLYETLKVPIGLIHTSWGGTPVEAWIPGESLEKYEQYKEIIEKLSTLTEEYLQLLNWIKSHPQIEIKTDNPKFWSKIQMNDSIVLTNEFDDSQWPEMSLPVLWEQGGIGEFDGIVWFRKSIEIPEHWVGKELIISLGKIDDMDVTYFNGVKIGGYEEGGYWQIQRRYHIPAHLVKPGKNIISVRVIDTQGGGGIWGTAEEMFITPFDSSELIKLNGKWGYMPVGELLNNRIYVYNITERDYFNRPSISIVPGPYRPSFLYNAMIHPLVPFAIKGVIWYQGESNVERAREYLQLFPELIHSWRKIWQQGDLPFYYVQIAPYKYSDPNNDESAWLREAQRRSLSVSSTGMVVTLDIGDVENIHPAHKKEVGERLANWALAKTYQKNIPFSGPNYEGAVVRGNKMYISFKHAGSGLVLKTDQPKEFEIAGDNQKFVKAKVQIEKNKLIVWNPKIDQPMFVRYAMKNGSEAELFNKEGLPASSFTTQDMQK